MKPVQVWYKNSRDLLDRFEKDKQKNEPHTLDGSMDHIVKAWQDVVDAFDEAYPLIKEWYMRQREIQKSFTPDQINFICEQIGEWYLMMKPLLEGTHNLGYMKEKLKEMICGE